MLEVIYRIYEAISDEDRLKRLPDDYTIHDNKNQIDMDCIICDSRDHFKDIVRERYGDDVTFRRPKQAKTGDMYCTIIAEHCYNTEKYFTKTEFTCDGCGSHITTFIDEPIRLNEYNINKLGGDKSLLNKRFCSSQCLEHFAQAKRSEMNVADADSVGWITPDCFNTSNTNGYIYKISKRSTGEFYIGQTENVPVFRWGQHLKTERFPLSNIDDYVFEVIYVCKPDDNRLEVEKRYIQEYYAKDPKHSLNIACTANVVTTKQKLF